MASTPFVTSFRRSFFAHHKRGSHRITSNLPLLLEQINAVTAGRPKTTTILGCGSAGGVAIPPFFVFPGNRMLPELMDGATPGAAGPVSDSGLSIGEVLRKYLDEHFLKFIPQREPGQHILLLLDGHKSHISVGALDWALMHYIFILPAHTSHVLQPMAVGCYGPTTWARPTTYCC